MRVLLIDHNKQQMWNQFVQTNPNVIAWHSYEYSDVLKKHYHLTFFPLAAYDGGAICGILPLYLVRTFRTGRSLISVPYFVAGGIVATNAEAQRLLFGKAIELAHQTRAGSIALRQYKEKVEGDLITDDGYYNRELALSRDLDAVWKSIGETNQMKTKEAQKYETVLEYPSEDLQTFYKLLLSDQHALGVPCVSKSWIESLLTVGMYKIALLRIQGTVVAGTMVKTFKDTVSFPFTCLPGHDERSELFVYSLYWQLIERLASAGIRILHSGRIPRGELSPAYRLGWGGTKYNYYYQFHQRGKTNGQTAGTRGANRSAFESVWKKIPMAVAGTIGPAIVRQFP